MWLGRLASPVAQVASPVVLVPIYCSLVIYLAGNIRRVTFEALAEPSRRQILDLLLAGEQPVGELVSALSISQPAVSKHLRVLRDAGLVSVRTDAQRRLYRVRPEPLREIDEWLAPYRRLWSERLDALERHLDEMA
jgi:DNA-binding transcriptional ArsR family regulator